MKTINSGQWIIALLETPSCKPQEAGQKLHLMTNHTVTILPYHISIIPVKSINHALSSNIKSNTLIEIEENPFLSIEQPDLIMIPMLQKLGLIIPAVYMAVLWNPGGQPIILKRNTTIARESDYMANRPLNQQENIDKRNEISSSTQDSDAVKRRDRNTI